MLVPCTFLGVTQPETRSEHILIFSFKHGVLYLGRVVGERWTVAICGITVGDMFSNLGFFSFMVAYFVLNIFS